MLLLVLAALSMGLSNFAGAIALGVAGISARTRVQVGVVFALFEGGMPLLGLLVGHSVVRALGSQARWVSGGLLVAIGLYALATTRYGSPDDDSRAHSGANLTRLSLTGLALSLDNLAVGFALGAYKIRVWLAVGVIAGVSVGLSLMGLELGVRLGSRAGVRGAYAAGLILMAVGCAVCAGLI